MTGVTSYNYRYKLTSAGTWTTNSTANTNQGLTGLTESSEYEFQVEAVCPGGASGYSASVNFTTLPPCGVPTNLNVSNTTPSTVTFNWTGHPEATKYQVIYRKAGYPWWVVRNAFTETLLATGLDAASLYTSQVKARCNGSWAGWSTPVDFVTAGPPCGVPQNGIAFNITGNAAQITCDAMAGATHYQVRYRAVGTSTWTWTTRFINLFSLDNLLPETDYEFKIIANCPSGWTSFSPVDTFTTLDSTVICDIPGNITVSNITSTTADVSWSTEPTSMLYQLIYRVDSVGSSWTILRTTDTSYHITGLSPGTTYRPRVATRCPQGWTGHSLPDGNMFTTSSSRESAPEQEELIPQESSLNIFPNPASNFIYLEWKAESSAHAQVEIFDMRGKEMLSISLQQVLGRNVERVAVDALQPGNYIVRIQRKEGALVQRVVIK